MRLLPSFESFRVEEALENELFFQLVVDDTLRPIKKEHRERIRSFETGNGETVVDKLNNGGYQYIIKDIKGGECALLQTN